MGVPAVTHRRTACVKRVGKLKPTTLKSARQVLRSHSNPQKAKTLQWFFKTGKGEYAEGDLFIGVTVPQIRKIVKQFQTLPLHDIVRLLASKIHEERLLALLILVSQFKHGDSARRKTIVDAYLANLIHVNNWDLVDSSAQYILGSYLHDKNRALLYKLVGSARLWDRRIAIISTFHFIKHGDFADTLKLATRLLKDPEDLIHKAVGWMLREVGKQDQKVLEDFLKIYSQQMPRTMLRYSIERFYEPKRRQYLKSLT